MRRLLAPRSVAVVGATERPDSYGSEALLNLGRLGYDGSVYAVNPRRESVHGIACHASLSDLPEAVDAVVVALPADRVVAVVDEAGALGCGGAVVFATGFAETASGVAAQAALVETARIYDLAVCGPNGNGIVSLAGRVALWGDHLADRPAGPVALVTQSGNVAVNALAARRGLGLHTVVSCGNAAVLEPADFVEAIAELDGVRAIALYLEDDGDGARWCDALEACAGAGIGVAVLKAGASPVGAAAAQAHTGAVAGDQRAVRAFFEACGAAWAEDPHDLLELAKALAEGPRGGRRLGVMTCSGGDSALAADLAAGLDIDLAPPPDVAALLPAQATVANPLDYTSLLWDHPERLEQLVAAFGRAYDRLLVLFDEPADAPPSWAAVLAAIRTSPTPLVVASTLPELAADGAVPGLRTGLRVAAALSTPPPDPARIAAIRAGVSTKWAPDPAHRSHRWLSEPEAKALLGDLAPEGRVVATPEAAAAAAAELGGRVAVKVVNAALQHKAVVGGVRLDPPDVAAAARDLLALGDEVLVERLVPAGPETLIAVRTDTIVPVLVVGADVLPLPVERDALDPAVAEVALRAVDVALAHDLALLELNPVIGGIAVDAVAATTKLGVLA